MKNTTMAFIGGGNMAASLIGGLILDGCSSSTIWVADPDQDKLDDLQRRFQVNITISNREAADAAQVVILAVKPQALKAVAMDLAEVIRRRSSLVVSIAAGIRETDIDNWLGGTAAVVRTMPNTPALVQSGATALYANARVSQKQRSLAESIMRAVGMVLWLDDEAQMDAVTALSGSGPAYFFLVLEALENAAVKIGLPRETARLLAMQTGFGAARMALESDVDSATLRARVTSKGGTTERAVAVLQDGGLQHLFDAALAAAQARSRELAIILGQA